MFGLLKNNPYICAILIQTKVIMKRLTWLFALLIASVSYASAETSAEVEDVHATQEKATIELPAWVKNIKFSGYGML